MTSYTEIKLAQCLGIEHMSPEEYRAVIDRIGTAVLDAAVGRLLLTLDAEAVQALEQHLEQVTSEEDVLEYLLKAYPQLEEMLEAEAASLQAEAMQVVCAK